MNASFADAFGHAPAAAASAPGRINLLGEHTDYNDGFVLPTATPQRTHVQVAAAPASRFRLFASDLGEHAEFARGERPQAGFAVYVYGCVEVLRERGVEVPPLDLLIASDVPIGVGLSSSAALEVAVLRALRAYLDLELADIDIARLAHRAEVEHARVRCGILDQMASSLGNPGEMLFIDTRSLELRSLPLPASVLAIDSGTRRSLAGTAYNERRAQCEEAARLLGVGALRDVADPQTLRALPPPLDRRARHVVMENRRVLAALQANAEEFGALMNASHASLRDDFEVSTPALDALAEALQRQPGVYGARLTGAGFGGACVALTRAGSAEELATRQALQALAALGLTGRVLVRGDRRA
jgi:galactokinase